MFDCLLRSAARTVPAGVWRTEVVLLARESGATGGRVRELAGVVAFGLRLRSEQATSGSPWAAWRQGAALGAVLLLGTAFTASLGGGSDVVAVLSGGALWSVVAGRRVPAVALAGVALTLVAFGSSSWSSVLSALVVGIIALAYSAGGVPGGRMWLGALGAAGLVVVSGGGAGAAVGIAWMATFAVPLVLVVAGGADPRLAAAAVVAWTWRFVAVDPTDVVDAVRALLDGQGLDVILVRLGLMAWGVALALLVAHRSSRSQLYC